MNIKKIITVTVILGSFNLLPMEQSLKYQQQAGSALKTAQQYDQKATSFMQQKIAPGYQKANELNQKFSDMQNKVDSYATSYEKYKSSLDALIESPVSAGTTLVLQGLEKTLEDRFNKMLQPPAPTTATQPAEQYIDVSIKNRAAHVTEEMIKIMSQSHELYYLLNNTGIQLLSSNDSRSEIHTRINEFLADQGYGQQISSLIEQLKSLKNQDTQLIVSAIQEIEMLRSKNPSAAYQIHAALSEFQIADYLFSVNKQILNFETTFRIANQQMPQSIISLVGFLKKQETICFNAYFPDITNPDQQKIGSLKEIRKTLKSINLQQLDSARSRLLQTIELAHASEKMKMLNQEIF